MIDDGNPWLRAVRLRRADDERRRAAGRLAVDRTRLPQVVVSYCTDAREWRLSKRYVLNFEGLHWEIRQGFAFDLASIPRPVWSLIAPFELSLVAPLLHDFLYFHRGAPPRGAVTPYRTFSRSETDRLFLGLMRAEGVPYWRRALAYAAVRLFGAFAWRT